MDKCALADLGRQFYQWHKDNLIRFECGSQSREIESELERIVGLIDYLLREKRGVPEEPRRG